MKKSLYFALLCLLIVSIVDARRPRRRKVTPKDPPCHMKKQEACLDQMDELGRRPQASSIITTNEGLDELCKTVNDSVECRRAFMRKCATPMQADLVDFLQEHFTESVKQFCETPSIRNTFLTHSPCVESKVLTKKPYHSECVNDVMASLAKGQRMVNRTLDEAAETGFDVTFSRKSLSDRLLDLTCCSYNRFQRCTMDLVVKECGQPAKDAMNDFARNTFGVNINLICPKKMFNPTKSLCRAIMPQTGSDSQTADLRQNPLGKYMLTYLNFILNYDSSV